MRSEQRYARLLSCSWSRTGIARQLGREAFYFCYDFVLIASCLFKKESPLMERKTPKIDSKWPMRKTSPLFFFFFACFFQRSLTLLHWLNNRRRVITALAYLLEFPLASLTSLSLALLPFTTMVALLSTGARIRLKVGLCVWALPEASLKGSSIK
ncbi:hypothetical protein Tco_0401011 [Tanacetum coccineum]